MSLKKEEYYMPPDLIIGNRVYIFGRDCLIYDCDDFTRQWFKQNYDQDMNPIQIKKPKANLVY
jgi:hypothetical protein